MATLSEFRAQYPQYNDMTDQQLADGLYNKYYSDMPREQFDTRIGLNAVNPPKEEPVTDPLTGAIVGSAPGPATPKSTTRFGDLLHAATTVGARGITGLLNAPFALTDYSKYGPHIPSQAPEGMSPQDKATYENIVGQPGETALRAFYRNVIPEYKPQTMPGKIAMGAASGAIAGAPLGVGAAALGALSGAGGESAAALGLPPSAQIAASVLPVLAMGPAGAAYRALTIPTAESVAGRIGTLFERGAKAGGTPLEGAAAEVLPDQTPPWYRPKPLSLADVNNPAIQGEAERVAQLPQESRDIAKTNLEARARGIASRLDEDVTTAIANGDSTFNTISAYETKRKAMASPLYDAAYKANPTIASPTIDKILATPAGQEALKIARVNMLNRREPMGIPDPELTAQAKDTGQVTSGGVAAGLNLKSLQYVKEAFDDMIRQARSNRPSSIGGLIQQKNDLLTEMDRLDTTTVFKRDGTVKTPGLYAQARQVWAGDSAAIDAVTEGSKIFSKHPDQIASEVGELDPGNTQLYRVGAVSAIQDKLSQGGGARFAFGLTKEDADMMRKRIRPLFANEGDYNDFINAATSEARMAASNNRYLQNSATLRRALQQEPGAETGKGFISGVAAPAAMGAAAFFTEPWASLPFLGRALTGARELAAGRSPAFNTEMSRQLFTMNPEQNRAILARIAAQRAAPNALQGWQYPLGLLGGGQASLLSGSIP